MCSSVCPPVCHPVCNLVCYQLFVMFLSVTVSVPRKKLSNCLSPSTIVLL